MLAEWLRENRMKSMGFLAGRISHYSDLPFLAGAAIVGFCIFLRIGMRDRARIAATMLVAALAAGLVSNMVKIASGRTRPGYQGAQPGWYGFLDPERNAIATSKFGSFPSSHTAVAAAFFGVTMLARRGCWCTMCLPMLLAGLVGFSRVYIRAHHLSDVVVGFVLGIGVAFLLVRTVLGRQILVWLKRRCGVLLLSQGEIYAEMKNIPNRIQSGMVRRPRTEVERTT